MPQSRGNVLTRKLGPLPGWAWLLVLGGGVLAGVYLRRRLANASSAAGQAGVAPANTSVPAGSDGSGGGSVGAGVAPAASGLDPGTEALLASTQSTLLGGFDELVNQTSTLVNGLLGTVNANTALAQTEVYAGVQAQQQSFDFASNSFSSALGLVNNLVGRLQPVPYKTVIEQVSSGGPGGGTPSGPSPATSGGGRSPVNTYAPPYRVPAAGGGRATIPGGPVSPATGLSGHGPQL